ncbi:hemagglutinin repeat-containing protein [Marinimicrobium sp. C6131]|uniref:two-partner secretion domain-containing protein n=1 Tax=Marinimicrobium sp. C6131 TaxID=3022676 RepID=UPI00223D1A1F|nr:hemagglutinin repeat-containing protein [Marinimicrobium sp. C6131]UZJ43522.1 hemagglutinin repeat-containing protein [Marinimicrobium sp. C6131]
MKRINSYANRLIVWAVSLCMVGQPLAASAEVIVDRNANAEHRAQLDRAQNGVDIVNITAASKAGVSHNKFSRFDVPEEGIILNNSRSEVNTQLGGYIAGNRNLRDGTAQIILNEVTGGHRSQLEGFTEIAGDQAEYVLANQWGITCDGCGFINTPKVTLATGRPEMKDGSLSAIRVTRGDVSIMGEGLNASNVDYVDILARSVAINADIHADRLRMLTGANQIDYASGGVDPIQAEGDAPDFALDSSALGGMYANAITLLGTEHGVGVRLAGDMATDAGNLVIDQSGKVEVNNLFSQNRLRIASSADVVSTGNLSADRIDVQAGSQVVLSGDQVLGHSEVDLRAERITNSGAVAAGYSDSGESSGNGLLLMSAGRLENSGSIVSSDTLKLLGGNLGNNGDRALIQSEGTVELEASHLDNRDGARIIADEALEILVSGETDNAGGVIASVYDELTLATLSLNNSAGLIHGGEATTVTVTDRLNNSDGRIESEGALALDVSGSLSNSGGTIGGSEGQSLDVSGDLDNRGSATAFSDHSLTLNLNQLDNRDGQISHLGEGLFELNIENSFLNQNGYLASAGSIDLSAGRIDNDSGYIGAEHTLRLSSINDFNNRKGTLWADQRLGVTAVDFDNTQGALGSHRIDVDVTRWDNTQASLSANEILVAVTEDMNNNNGQLHAQSRLNMTVLGLVDNTDGRLMSDNELSLQARELRNIEGALAARGEGGLALAIEDSLINSGSIYSLDGELQIAAGSLNNDAGLINQSGAQPLTLVIDNVLSNQQGEISANHALSLTAAEVNNAVGELFSRDLSVVTGNFGNHQGLVEADSLAFNISGDLNNTGVSDAPALIRALGSSGAASTIEVDGQLDNQFGEVQAVSDQFVLNATALDNREGLIWHGGEGDARIQVVESINNTRGALIGQGAILAQATDINNKEGLIQATDSVDVSAGNEFSNAAGQVTAGSRVNLEFRLLDSTAGQITSNQVTISGSSGNNRGGAVDAGQDLQITTSDWNNTDGWLGASGALELNLSGRLNNQRGELYSESDIRITSEALDNTDGRITAGSQARVNASEVDNSQGELLASGLIVDGGTLVNRGGVIESDTLALTLLTDLINTENGLISVLATDPDALTIASTGVLNNTGGRIQTNADSAQLQASSWLNQGGQILHLGEGELRLGSAIDLDNEEGAIESNGSLNLSATTLNNTGGLIASRLAHLEVEDAFVNERGMLDVVETVTLNTGHLNNVDGTLSASGTEDSHIASDSLDNRRGLIQSNADTLSLTSDETDNTAGTIRHAGTGALIIRADDAGSLNNDGGSVLSNARIDLSVADVTNRQGEFYAPQLAWSGTGLDNTGGLIEAEDLVMALSDSLVNGNQDELAGLITALSGFSLSVGETLNNAGGSLQSSADEMVIAARSLRNESGRILQGGSGTLELDLQDGLDNQSGWVNTNGALRVASGRINNQSGQLLARHSVSLNLTGAEQTGHLDNRQGLIDTSAGLTVQAASIDNRSGTLLSAGSEASELTVDTLFDNRGGQVLSNADQFTLSAETLDNSTDGAGLAGLIQHNGNTLTLEVDKELNNRQGEVLSAGALRLEGAVPSDLTIDNTLGVLASETLAVNAGNLINSGGVLEADILDLALTGNLDNQVHVGTENNTRALISALSGEADSLSLQVGGSLTNSGSVIRSAGADGTITVGGKLVNQEGLVLHTGTGTLRLDLQEVDNRGGRIDSDGALAIAAGSLNNRAGSLVSEHHLDLQIAGQLNNERGEIDSAQSLSIEANDIINRAGVLSAAGEADSTLNATTFDNSGGRAVSNAEQFTIQADELINQTLDGQAGQIHHAGQGVLNLNVSDQLDNSAGELISNSRLMLSGGTQLDNQLGLIYAPEIAALLARLDNTGGTLSGERLDIQLSGDLINGTVGEQRGLIAAMSDMGSAEFRLTADGTIDNQSGTLQTDADSAAIESAALVNDGGRLLHLANGTLDLSADEGGLSNRNGLIVTDGSITADAKALDNQKGEVIAQRDMAVSVAQGSLTNDQGLVSAGGRLILSGGSLSNQDGELFSAGTGDVAWNFTGEVNNAGTILSNAGHFDLSADRLLNKGTLHHSGDRLAVTVAQQLDNDGGELASASELQLTAPELISRNAGTILGERVTLTADRLSNTDYALLEAEQLTLNILELTTNRGDAQLRAYAQAGAQLQLGSDLGTPLVIDNRGGRIETNALDVQLHTAGFMNEGGRLIHAGDGMLQLISGSDWNNQGGAILSNGALSLTAANLDNSAAGTLQSLEGMTLSLSGALDNRDQGLIDTAANLTLEAEQFDNTEGSLFSAGAADSALTVRQSLNNTDGLLLTNGERLTLTLGSLINARVNTETGGVINHAGQGALRLDVSGAVDNDTGELGSAGSMDVEVQGAFNNQVGVLFAAERIGLQANTLDNQSGTVQAGQVSLTATEHLDNDEGGKITALGLAGESEALTLVAGGALTNQAGLIQGVGGSTSLQAQSLDNSTGDILQGDAHDLSVTSDGQLLNRGGAIQSVGSLTLSAAEIVNTQATDGAKATMASGGNLSLSTIGSLNNQGSVISSNQTLELSAESIDNQKGAISAYGNGENRLTATTTLDNTSGSLYFNGGASEQSLQVGDSLLNVDGELAHSGTGNLMITAPRVDNSTLVGRSDAERNPQGALLSSNGRVLFSGLDALLNNGTDTTPPSLISASHIELTGSDANAKVENRFGQLIATGSDSLLVSGFELDNDNGLLYSNGPATLDLNGLSNTGGSLESLTDLTLSLDTFSFGDGELKAQRDLTINTADNLNVLAGSNVSAAGSLYLNVDGFFSNRGDIEANGTLSIQNISGGGRFENSASGTLTGDERLEIEFGDVVNYGIMGSQRVIDLSGGNFRNHETVVAGQNLEGTFGTVDNYKLIFSGDTLQFNGTRANGWGTSIRNRTGADIYAIGDLELKASSVENLSGRIESRSGNIRIEADQLQNKQENIDIIYHDEVEVFRITEGQYPDQYTYVGYETNVDQVNLSGGALLSAGESLDISVGYITNTVSTMSAGENIVFNGFNLSNEALEVYDEKRQVSFPRGEGENEDARTETFTYELYDSYASEILAGGVILGDFTGQVDNVTIREGYDHESNILNEEAGAASPGSVQARSGAAVEQQSAANLDASVESDNYNATAATSGASVEAVESGRGDVTQATHQGADVTADEVNSTQAQTVTSGSAQDSFEGQGRSGEQIASNGESLEVEGSQREGVQVDSSNRDSSSLTDTGAGSDANRPDAPETQTPELAEGGQRDSVPDATEDNNPQPVQPPEPPPAPVASGEDIELAEIYNPADNISLPQDGSLFVISPEPSANYLVETNPLLTDYLEFLSSDYLLERLGVDPADLSKRLGDGFYETDLVREAIWSTRGRRFLTNTDGVAFESDEAQFQYLMDNALAASEDLELRPGVALTAEQASRLTQDIVWLEEQEVDGQQVLVPVYYATTANGTEFNGGGAVIAGAQVQINADGGFNNDGTIAADGQVALRTERDFSNVGRITGGSDITIDAGRITHERVDDLREAVIESRGGDMNLIARTGYIQALSGRISANDLTLRALEGQIENRASLEARGDLVARAKSHIVSVVQTDGEGGRIQAGSDLTLIAEEGDIISRSATERRTGRAGDIVSMAGRADIRAGGNLQMSAGRDIELTASDLTAGGDARLRAERDITLDALETRSADMDGRVSSKRSHITRTTETGHEVTNLSAGGDLALSAGRDLTSRAASLEAGENIDLHAERDTRLLSVTNTRTEELESSYEGSLGRRKSRSEYSETTDVVGTRVQAGGNITVNSRLTDEGQIALKQSRDVQIESGQLVAGGDLVVGAQRDITIEGAEETRHTASQSRKQDWSGLKSRRDWSVQSETGYAGSELAAANDATLVSGRDTDIVGSQVAAGNDLQAQAGVLDDSGSLTLREGMESRRDYQATQKRSPTASLEADDNSVNAFVGNQRERTSSDVTQVRGQGSTLVAGNNVTAHAANDLIIEGSDVAAGNNARLTADNNVLIRAGQTDTSTEQGQRTTRDGLGLTLNHNLGQAKDALENLGQGDNTVSKVSGVLRAADALNNAQPSASAHLGKTTTESGSEQHTQGARASRISAGGNIDVAAGNRAELTGVELDAGDDIQISGTDVVLVPADTTGEQQNSTDFKQTGATLQASTTNASLTAGYAKADSEQSTRTTGQVGNQLTAGGSIALTAENDVLVRGSDFNAGENIDLTAGNNIDLLAGTHTQNSASDSDHESGGAGVNLGSNGVGFTAQAAGGRDRLNREATQHTNSQLTAGNAINLTSGNDTTISGANAEAKHLNVNVGGDLTVASVQDTGSADGRREDYSGSITVGAGVSGGANVGRGETEGSTAWVSNQTSLIGSESVNIQVDGHTQVDGALIANIKNDGTDGGNLNLDTGTLGYTNFEDHDRENSDYASVGFGTGGNAGANAQTSAHESFEGTSGTLDFTSRDKDRQQITRATLGEGNITARDNPDQDLSDLNRDIDTAQEILKDKDETTDVYASTTSVESLKGLTETGEDNTLNQWASNIGSIADPDSYKAMADNAAQLGNADELKSGWEQAKKTLGVTGELPPELDAKNQQLRDQIVRELTEQNDGEVPDNLQLYLDQNGDIAAAEVDGVPVYMDADLEQQFAAELEERSQRQATELALAEESDANIDALSGTLDDVWSNTDQTYFTALGESNQRNRDLGAPDLLTPEEQKNLNDFLGWRAPAIAEHEAQYGARRDMGDMTGEVQDIGLTLLGGASRSILDNTTDIGGLLIDGLARGSYGMPGQLPYGAFGQTPMEVEPIGSNLARELQAWANTHADSSDPNAFSGGYQNDSLKSAMDTVGIVMGTGAMFGVGRAHQAADIGVSLRKPKQAAVDLPSEPITDPSRLLEYKPAPGSARAGQGSGSQADELWIELYGEWSPVGRKGREHSATTKNTRDSDINFYADMERTSNSGRRAEARGKTGEVVDAILDFLDKLEKGG